MRVFIIDTRNMGPELQGGMIGVIGSLRPSPEEKRDCIEVVSRYVVDGWAVAADPSTPIGRLAALTAEAACVPFVRVGGARMPQWPARTIEVTRSPERDFAGPDGSPIPALAPDACIRRVGQADSRTEIGSR